MPETTETELPSSVKPIWLKALTAVQTNNHAYAITLLQNVVKDQPAFLEGRKLLRQCAITLSDGTKKKSLFGLQTGMMKVQGSAKKDPLGALPLIEKELEKDPFNEAANDLLYDVAMKLEMPDTAAFALETIRRGVPENAKLMHKLAAHYLALDKPELAVDVFNDIIRYHPTDGVAIKGSKDASARASMMKARWDENADMRTLMKDAAQFEELEKASRTGLTREQLEDRRDKTVERYNQDQNNLPVVKELASLYEQLEDWHNAHSFFSWAHSLSNGDVALATKAASMKDKAIEKDLKDLQAAVEADPTNEELRTALASRTAERVTEQVHEAQSRVDQNPTDPHLRFQLGQALYQAGDYSSAIPHLQQATRNPHIRTKVLLLLGRTFKAKSMFDLSIKQLSDALADLHAMDATKKEILYEKGLIHEETGDKTSALDCFKQIYEVDYSYRDVANRVESSYS